MLSELLLGHLPETVVCCGKPFQIYTDFRVWIEVEQILFEREGNFLDKVPALLKLCYPALPDTLEAAVFGMTRFYTGEEPHKGNSLNKKRAKPIYSFYQDAALIYAGFYQQYGIDLTTVRLHWYQFRALLSGLGEETLFRRVIGYRVMDISSIKSKEKRQFYAGMKALYKLRDYRTEEEKEDDVSAVLAGLF